jgi:Na+/melibiose symporter-like transporter
MLVALLISLALFYMDMESDRREKRHHETQILSQRQPSIKPSQPKIRRSGSEVSKLGTSKISKSGEVRVEETDSNLLEGAQNDA